MVNQRKLGIYLEQYKDEYLKSLPKDIATELVLCLLRKLPLSHCFKKWLIGMCIQTDTITNISDSEDKEMTYIARESTKFDVHARLFGCS